jgi:hypothetical protein
MQSVKLSDELVLEARTTGKIAERSLSGQIDYWAGLGRAVERVMHAPEALALKRSAGAMTLSECLDSVDTAEGRRRLADVLAARPFPHFEAADKPGFLIRIDNDGTRTVGRFVDRSFVAYGDAKK